MNACKTSETPIRSVDFINVNFLVLILNYNYERHYHWRKLGEGYMGPPSTFFATTYESIITSNQKLKGKVNAEQDQYV